MIFLWAFLALAAVCFGFVILFGAPYLPTLRSQQKIALDLLKLKPGQVLYDLGCGDGRLLSAAARQGIKAVGYEINPIMAAWAWLATRRHRRLVKVVWGNFWRAGIDDADAVYVFLISRYMGRLDKYLNGQKFARRVAVASYGFEIPAKKAQAARGGVFLYFYGPVARRR